MKDERTLLQKVVSRLRASATKVNPRAKKGFKASLKGRGYSNKAIKAATKKADASAKAAAKAAKAPGETPEKDRTAARIQQLAKLGGQLRVTPRKGKF